MKKILIVGIMLIVLLVAGFSVFYFQGIYNTPPRGKIITNIDLIREYKNLEKINVHPANYNINPDNYPIVLGPYEKNGVFLVEKYHCSDVCPDNGRVVLVFQNITSKEECAKIEGNDIIDPAWGGYIGCTPGILID